MKKYLSLIVLLYTNTIFSQAPGGVTGFAAWLKAGDERSYSLEARQGVSNFTDAPTGLMNYNGALQLDGRRDNLFFPILAGKLSQATVIVVYMDDEPGKKRLVWQLRGKFGAIQLSTQNVVNDFDSLSFDFEQSQSPVINTYIKSWKTRGAESDNEQGLVLAPVENGDMVFKGKLAEYILYDRVLKLAEQRKIESSLAIKYGISLKKNYVNSAGKTTWNYEDYKSSSSNILGIGRDDAAALYQKQSMSGDPKLPMTISSGSLALNNYRNQATISDQDFIVIGDDNGKLELNEIAEGLLHRRWLTQVSGNTAYLLSTELSINVKGILIPQGNPKGKYFLAIDRNADGNFSNGSTEYIEGTISKDNIVTFKNIHWDKDRSGADRFTLAYRVV
ncbi:MAG TPA: hypothetical protein VIZ28_07760, partial [Chitinophagaceae bacterium]